MTAHRFKKDTKICISRNLKHCFSVPFLLLSQTHTRWYVEFYRITYTVEKRIGVILAQLARKTKCPWRPDGFWTDASICTDTKRCCLKLWFCVQKAIRFVLVWNILTFSVFLNTTSTRICRDSNRSHEALSAESIPCENQLLLLFKERQLPVDADWQRSAIRHRCARNCRSLDTLKQK